MGVGTDSGEAEAGGVTPDKWGDGPGDFLAGGAGAGGAGAGGPGTVVSDGLVPHDRLAFERLLQCLRLSFLVVPLLVLGATSGAAVVPASVIVLSVALSYAGVWLLLRRTPPTLLRWQFGIRLVDCLLILVSLTSYHAFLGDAYYDAVYVLFVVAAAATHGRQGAIQLALAATVATLSGRLLLIFAGAMPFAWRHLTDTVFFGLLFLVTGLAVGFLMRKSGQEVERREGVWRASLEARNLSLQEAMAARERALAETEAAFRTRDEVLATVSHDLKNPLTVIRAQAALVVRQIDRPGGIDPVRTRRSARAIENATFEMQSMIEEILDAARLRSGQPLELDRRTMDLVALAQRVVARAAQTTSSHDLRVDTALPALAGNWDASRLERVMSNLLSNAIKYSPHGGEVVVWIGLDQSSAAVVSVSDQGMGVPAADLPHIFERFHRAGNVSGNIPGTGLGLASAYHVLEQHGGTISVVSAEGRGSTFTIRLPLE